MSFTKKIISVAAGVALVAGAGAMAATPASASKHNIKGDTVIEVPMAIIQAAGAAGVSITPNAPASAEATMEAVGVVFPVTGPSMDGVLHHNGGLSLASSNTGITLTWDKPEITWATSGGDTAAITGVVGGIPAGSGFEQLNGQRAQVFTVTDFTIKNKPGKPKKSGKVWKRTDVQTLSGVVTVVDNPTVVQILNGLMGAEIFVAGMEFGALGTAWGVTHTCKTKKACKA